MSLIGGTPRTERHKVTLNGKPFHILTPAEAGALGGRAWTEQTYELQQVPNEQQFAVNLSSGANGAGYTFGSIKEVYECANGWDATAPDKISTWPRRATGAPKVALDYLGWNVLHGGFNYWMRGRYVNKCRITDAQNDVWPIIESHDLGANMVVAGRPFTFKNKLYVPVYDTNNQTLQRFHELTTVATFVVEIQTIVISGTPTGGTYTITFDGKTSTALAFNADGATVQAALRAIPGLEQVTVVTTGTTPNFTHTVTMTGVGGALGGSSPAQMTSTSSLTGGAPVITHATTTAGTSDTWTQGPSGKVAKCFHVWEEKLVAADVTTIRTVSADPMVSGDWSADYTICETGQHINDLGVWDKYLLMGCTDGMRSLDETLRIQNELPDLRQVVDDNNCLPMEYVGGYMFIAHKFGLIQWTPGSYALVGPEQEGALEGDLTMCGWGRVTGIVPYGKYAFVVLNNSYHGVGTIMALLPGSEERQPLTPHIYHQTMEGEDETFEAGAILSILSQPAIFTDFTAFSDDAAIGTVAWSNPQNAENEDNEVATTASAGTTHYLKALNPHGGAPIPEDAIIRGILLRVKRYTTVA